MKTLSELHLDALTEVFNIGAGRAASSLSEIVGEEVKLSVPRLQLVQPADINMQTLALNSPRLGAVKQQFSGPFDADAMLLFTEERALEIVRDMMGSHISIEELAEYEQDAMCELGNIILNACLSAMADILKISFQSSLPRYVVDSSDVILRQIIKDTNLSIMLALHIDLTIEKHHTQGNLVFLLNSTSLQELIAHIDHFISGI
ncbi:MAG: chemotaxis protein CheX [Gallionella sp.]|nr:chemotaxis protein CheX [Gallionella sp.]